MVTVPYPSPLFEEGNIVWAKIEKTAKAKDPSVK
jgi:hypothetical protein